MKKRQQQTVLRNPLARLQPLPRPVRDRLVLRAYTALETMTQSKLGGDVEAWRDLADVVNVTETMATKCQMLSSNALTYTQASNDAMKAAQARFKEGKALRLDGAGIEALRAVIAIYEQCLRYLTETQVEEAFVTTQNEVQRLIAEGAEAVSL